MITQQDIRNEIGWLVERVNGQGHGRVFDRLIERFEPRVQRINEMLFVNNINVHDFDHQQRVAGVAMAMGRGFGVNDRDREAMGLAACFHDVGYPVQVDSDQPVSKQDLDYHAQAGAVHFRRLKSYPELRAYFNTWTPEMERIAFLGIKYHNGGNTAEYLRHRSSIPLPAKLVRAADKSDNRTERVFDGHLMPTIRQTDAHFEHRLAPAAIEHVSYVIDTVRKHIELIHQVDRTRVEVMVGEYPVEELQRDFAGAYGNSMGYIREVMSDALQWPAEDDEPEVTLDAVFVEEGKEVARLSY